MTFDVSWPTAPSERMRGKFRVEFDNSFLEIGVEALGKCAYRAFLWGFLRRFPGFTPPPLDQCVVEVYES